MSGVRGFSWKPKPAAKPAPAREVPTVQLEEEVGPQTLHLNLEQAAQLYESLSQDQKDHLATLGISPGCCGCGTNPDCGYGACGAEDAFLDPHASPLCQYVEFRGDASAFDPETVHRVSQGLRGLSPLRFTEDHCRVRIADGTSSLQLLSECGDARCGAHRLRHPEVRARFRSFVLRSIRKSKKEAAAWWREGLFYASLGSGHLLWDCEMLDRIRAEGVEIRQICLIDVAYGASDAATRIVIQAFADWQAAVSELWEEPAPQVLAFASSEAYFQHCGAGGMASGCNLFMHCDAAFQGSEEECRRLAGKALVPTGLLARLNNLGSKQVPEEMLQKGPEMLRKYWQVQQEHSEEPFSAGAWLSHGDGDLEPLQDYLLGADPEEKAWQQMETDHRFKQAERSRAEEVGLEVWRVKCLDPVTSRRSPEPTSRSFGQVSPGEVLVAAERNGDWIRVAGTADLWGVEYSARAKAAVAAPPAHTAALDSEPAEPMPADDSSVWVPIDGSCLGETGRFLEQIYVPPGRDPWAPGAPSEGWNLALDDGSVTLRGSGRDRRGSCAAGRACHFARARQRQRERAKWRAVLHESTGQRTAVLAALQPEERARLRSFLKTEQRRWQALALELSQLKGFARRERLAQLSIEDRTNLQQWLLEKAQRQKTKESKLPPK
ncbi:unnamed protein product [Effrenium voratum]|nr:unnamed protein product [Effrenium voratum]